MPPITAKQCDTAYEMDKAYNKRGAVIGSSISSVHQNMDAAKQYVLMISEGNSGLQHNSGSMGSRQFKSTKLKCKDKDTQELVDLWNWQDNKPLCVSPNGDRQDCGIMSGIKKSVSNLESDLGGIFHIFDTSTKECVPVTLDIVNGCTQSGNDPTTQTAYITTDQAKKISPCIFTDKKNPYTDEVCKTPLTPEEIKAEEMKAAFPWLYGKESFATISSSKQEECCCANMPKDPLVKIYYTSIGVLMLYFIMKMTLKR